MATATATTLAPLHNSRISELETTRDQQSKVPRTRRLLIAALEVAPIYASSASKVAALNRLVSSFSS
jgi:hypothetical protein